MESIDLKPKKEVTLETHRFAISPESILLMKKVRERFKLLQEKYPELVAISFFGSRIRGKEHGASEEIITHKELGQSKIQRFNSDLDIIILYNENLIPRQFRRIRNSKRVSEILSEINGVSHSLKKEKDISIGLDITGIDVSESRTQEDLLTFKKAIVDSATNPPLKIHFYLGEGSPFYDLAARFVLSVGNIYSVRQTVLDDFAKEKNGETYWMVLMKILREFERPQQDHHTDFEPTGLLGYDYPQTLAEGREYFLKLKKKEVPLQ